MMKNRYKAVLVVIILIVAVGFFVHSKFIKNETNGTQTTLINPVLGNVELTVMTTGIVEPQNRLEIKPTISGRIEKILVREGDSVNMGDTLALMSSTERAALVDAARSQGEEVLKYWEDVYKQTPIISPLAGEVIVRSVEPGQTVTTSDAVIVLSDRLIINAQFDETDIGRVKVGQKAIITLDAYPDIKLIGGINHIAYESKIVNNVTTYDVDILPNEIPEVMRSGMSVTVEVVEKSSANVLTIPSSAIHIEGDRQFVLLKKSSGKTIERTITVGVNNEKTAEIISGLTLEDSVVVEESAFMLKRKSTGTNPFMPSRRR